MPDIAIESIDPTGAEAVAWSAALWGEIQRRYHFVAPDPYDATSFTPRVQPSGWHASRAKRPAASPGAIGRQHDGRA